MVRVVDHGADAVLRVVSKRKLGSVSVGVLGPAANEQHGEGELTTAQIAEIHEFGLGVPRRSFILDWANENEPAIKKKMADLFRPVLLGKRTTEQAYALFGVWAQGQIQARISAGIDPPLAASTIARKGSSKPLIDTGQLRTSISFKVDP